MRIFFALGSMVIFHSALFAQNNGITSEGQEENLKGLASSVFKYPSFVNGEIILKDSSKYDARLNYSRILGKFLVIDKTGKTRPFANPDTLAEIIASNDTFYYSNSNFLQKLTHLAGVNLYVKETLAYVEKQKKGYDGTPVVSSDGSHVFSNFDDSKKDDISIDRDSQFQFIREYFIADKSMDFVVATKRSFYDLFPGKKNQLKTFMRDHSVNFSNADQMGKLLQYINGL